MSRSASGQFLWQTEAEARRSLRAMVAAPTADNYGDRIQAERAVLFYARQRADACPSCGRNRFICPHAPPVPEEDRGPTLDLTRPLSSFAPVVRGARRHAAPTTHLTPPPPTTRKVSRGKKGR